VKEPSPLNGVPKVHGAPLDDPELDAEELDAEELEPEELDEELELDEEELDAELEVDVELCHPPELEPVLDPLPLPEPESPALSTPPSFVQATEPPSSHDALTSAAPIQATHA
jgi:hypothetical protein